MLFTVFRGKPAGAGRMWIRDAGAAHAVHVTLRFSASSTICIESLHLSLFISLRQSARIVTFTSAPAESQGASLLVSDAPPNEMQL